MGYGTKNVIFCLRLYLIEIVQYIFMISFTVGWMKRNVEKYIPKCVRMQHGFPNSAIEASENHVGVKRGVKYCRC